MRLASRGSSIAATSPTSALGTPKYALEPGAPLRVSVNVVPSGLIPTGAQPSLEIAAARLAEETCTTVGSKAGCRQRLSIEPEPLMAPDGVLEA